VVHVGSGGPASTSIPASAIAASVSASALASPVPPELLLLVVEPELDELLEDVAPELLLVELEVEEAPPSAAGVVAGSSPEHAAKIAPPATSVNVNRPTPRSPCTVLNEL
jgi:hypothetical protein